MTVQTPNISITRTFSAPPDRVFAAWTTPALFGRWFGTAATEVVDVVMDVRVGGEWRARMILGDGKEIRWHGAYVEVDAPERLALTISDNPGDEYDLVTVVLRSVSGGTEMVFTQSGDHMPPENYAQAEAGWRAFFDDLASGLAD